jgi:hypothetical protein
MIYCIRMNSGECSFDEQHPYNNQLVDSKMSLRVKVVSPTYM